MGVQLVDSTGREGLGCQVPAATLSEAGEESGECPGVPQKALQTLATALKG